MIASKENEIAAFQMLFKVEALLEKGRFKEGINILGSILERFPDFGPANNHLGWLYSTQFNDYPKAKAYFEKALELDPAYPHTYFNLASLLRNLNQCQEARDILTKAIEVPSVNTAKVRGELALTYELQEDYKVSIDVEEIKERKLYNH